MHATTQLGEVISRKAESHILVTEEPNAENEAPIQSIAEVLQKKNARPSRERNRKRADETLKGPIPLGGA
jgi:hypothetical protein